MLPEEEEEETMNDEESRKNEISDISANPQTSSARSSTEDNEEHARIDRSNTQFQGYEEDETSSGEIWHSNLMPSEYSDSGNETEAMMRRGRRELDELQAIWAARREARRDARARGEVADDETGSEEEEENEEPCCNDDMKDKDKHHDDDDEPPGVVAVDDWVDRCIDWLEEYDGLHREPFSDHKHFGLGISSPFFETGSWPTANAARFCNAALPHYTTSVNNEKGLDTLQTLTQLTAEDWSFDCPQKPVAETNPFQLASSCLATNLSTGLPVVDLTSNETSNETSFAEFFKPGNLMANCYTDYQENSSAQDKYVVEHNRKQTSHDAKLRLKEDADQHVITELRLRKRGLKFDDVSRKKLAI